MSSRLHRTPRIVRSALSIACLVAPSTALLFGCDEPARAEAALSATSPAAAALPGPVATEADLKALPPVRFNNAHLVPPAGWNKALADKTRYVFEHPSRIKGAGGNPKTERLTIEVNRAVQISDGKLQPIVEGDTAYFKATYKDYKDDAPPKAGKTKAGLATLTHLCSHKSGFDFWDREYYAIVHVDGGAWSQSFTLQTTRPDWRDKWLKTVYDLADSAVLSSRIKLAEAPAAVGGKPLTLFDVYQTADFLEWMLDLPFTDGQREYLRQHYVEAWRKADKGEVESIDAVYALRAKMDDMDLKQRDLMKQVVRAEVIKGWREEAKAGDAGSKWILGLYDGANQPIAKGKEGEPWLTTQATDAMLEMLFFMACRVDKQADETPTAAHKAAWTKQMAEAYPAMTPEQKNDLVATPTTWAALRVTWPDASEADKTKALSDWAKMPAVQTAQGQLRDVRAQAANAAEAYKRYSSYQQTKAMSDSIMRRTDMFRAQTMNNMRSSYRY